MNTRDSWYTAFLFLVMITMSSCLRPVYETLSKSYYKNWRGQIVYTPSGNWFERGSTPLKGVHRRTFKVLSEEYAKDKNRVYFRSDELQGADAASFEVLPFRYGKDREHVFLGRFMLKGLRPYGLRPVSPKYLVQGDSAYYIRHSSETYDAWCEVKSIAVEHPERFRMLDDRRDFASDGTAVYFRALKLPLQGAPRPVLCPVSALQPAFLWQDTLQVVSREEAIGDVDRWLSTTVRPLGADTSSGYFLKSYAPVSSIASTGVWAVINGNMLALIQREQLNLIARGGTCQVNKEFPSYARSSDTVYYCQGIPDKDPMIVRIPDPDRTFEAFSLTYARIRGKIYYRGEVVNGADTRSFRVLSKEEVREHRYRYDAADNRAFYQNGEAVVVDHKVDNGSKHR